MGTRLLAAAGGWCVAVALSGGGAAAQMSFTGGVDHRVGDSPAALAVGDFNGDRVLDLVTANQDSNDVSVLLGTGGGNFGGETRFPVGDQPQSVAVGDFNADGDPDLAVANSLDDAVSVLLGAPGGGFAPQMRFRGEGDRVAVGDFDADGEPDLALSSLRNDQLSMLLGGGGGGFGPPSVFAVGRSPVGLAVGDFNGDRDPDLATGNQDSNDVSVLLGTAGGGFASPASFRSGAIPAALSVGDFNRDGDPDLAVATFASLEGDEGSDGLSLLQGAAGGDFGSPRRFAAGRTPRAVAVGDFDADGLADVAVANEPEDVSVLAGEPGGGFAPPIAFTGCDFPDSLAVADFDADGRDDLAVGNAESDDATILLGAPPSPERGTVVSSEPGLGCSVGAAPSAGTVLVSERRSASGGQDGAAKGAPFVPLRTARQLRVGSLLDTRRGRVAIRSARGRSGKTQRGEFSGGVFQVRQSRQRRARGLTELRLKGSSFRRRCRGGRSASASRQGLSRRTVRRLRGRARGRFRTRGRHSAATVRGTTFVVADRCDGTLTRVKRGKVVVRDFRRNRTIVLRRGESYLARPRP